MPADIYPCLRPQVGSAMALPAAVWDPICSGILECLNGWALVSFLATCKAARKCESQLRRVQMAREEIENLNKFLAAAILHDSLRLPGFDPRALATAWPIPINPMPALPGRNMQLLLDKTYALNPRAPTAEAFQAWLQDFYGNREELAPYPDMGNMLLEMHGPDNALFDSINLEILANAFCHHLSPSYTPSWAPISRSPVLVHRTEATRYPAFLLAWAECRGFPVLLFACEYIAAIPGLALFGSEHDISGSMRPIGRARLATRAT